MLVGVLTASIARRRSWLPPVIPLVGSAVCSVVLVGAATVTYRDSARNYDRVAHAVRSSAYPTLAATVDDGRGVIGARSHTVFMPVTADIPTWGDQFLSERAYVTYLTWPSDDEVIAMMQKHDIGWVLIHPWRHLETTYNDTWLLPHYGLPSRHVEAVAESPRFCLRSNAGGFLLYELGPCERGDA
jgi:hypothetical protein